MTITRMPTRTAAYLVANALHHLWSSTQDPALPGCCPECCGPCSALRNLLHAGQLDDLYGEYLAIGDGESQLWDPAARQVRRDWPIPAWSMDLGCRVEHEVGP